MTLRRIHWFTLAAPSRFYQFAGLLLPWLASLAAVLGGAALYVGFFVAPTDAQQGESYRIMFVHVPAAWLSLLLYLALAFWSTVGGAFNARMAAMLAQAIAPTGALFTLLALGTGALWGRPTWGTWWVWDARLTSEFVLLLLYLGHIALMQAIEDPRRADRAGALLAVVGVVNVPVIHFSVKWWNTLHQGASVTLSAAPTMATTMFTALALSTLAFWSYSLFAVLVRTRAIVLEREADAAWVRRLRTMAVEPPHPAPSGTLPQRIAS